MIARARNLVSTTRHGLRELIRLTRAFARSRRRVLVGYTKPHPIYTDVLEDAPPDGFAGYRACSVPWLRPLDQYLRRRVRLVHCDAASTPDAFDAELPLIVECEGHPHPEFFRSPRVKRVFVESRWAGGNLLDRGDVALLRPAVPIPPRAVRKQSDSGRLVVLAVGYGALVKGFDVAARIVETLRTEFPLKLVIAGTLPHNSTYYPEIAASTVERADLERFERRLRSESWIDLRPRRRSEMARIYAAADINMHFSRLETFGYSILEAMSHGLPVVATRLHAIPEMVDHGRTGYLCDPGDADINSSEWQDRMFHQGLEMMRRLLSDASLRKTMGEAGRQRVAHAFDINVKRQRLANAYREAISLPASVRPKSQQTCEEPASRKVMEEA